MPPVEGQALLAAAAVAVAAFGSGWSLGRQRGVRDAAATALPPPGLPGPPGPPAPAPRWPDPQELAELAHDLKNPLSTLRLRVELDVPEPAAAAWYADIDAVEHLLRQHGVHAQVRAGLEPGPPAPLREVLEWLRGREGLPAWRLDAAEADLDALAVPARAFELMLWNLLHNAGRHGRAPVTLTLRRTGDEARLLVLDGGPGLDAAALARVLQPPPQPPPQRPARRSGDAGLGLAIVALLAGRVGGRLLHQPFDGSASGLGIAWAGRGPAVGGPQGR